MAIARPGADALRAIGESVHIRIGADEAQEFATLLEGNLRIYDVLDALPDDLPPVKYARTPGHRPRARDNPLNAWYWQTDIRGAARGRLKDRRVVFKDNILVAGVPIVTPTSTGKTRPW